MRKVYSGEAEKEMLTVLANRLSAPVHIHSGQDGVVDLPPCRPLCIAGVGEVGAKLSVRLALHIARDNLSTVDSIA